MDDDIELIKKTNPKVLKKTYIIVALIILAIIIIDQVTKFIAIKINYMDVIHDFLNFHIAENTSGSYGIGFNSTLSYVLTNLVVISVLIKFITTQNEFIDTKLRIVLSLIIGGGISNTLDRIFRGFVVEFIDFKALPVLNIADIFVILGWISFIIIFTSFTMNEMKSNKNKKSVKLEENSKTDKEKDEKDEKNEKNNINKEN